MLFGRKSMYFLLVWSCTFIHALFVNERPICQNLLFSLLCVYCKYDPIWAGCLKDFTNSIVLFELFSIVFNQILSMIHIHVDFQYRSRCMGKLTWTDVIICWNGVIISRENFPKFSMSMMHVYFHSLLFAYFSTDF